MKILLTLSYLGTGFSGYQVQKSARTVQGELNAAARALFGYDCDITGCSRTDSGVHANMFCATVTKKDESYLETHISEDKIPAAMNAHLPADMSVTRAEWVSDEFHPRYDVKYKEYVYMIDNRQARNPFTEGRAWHIPYTIDEASIDKMNRAAQHYVGKHDFLAFMASGSTVESTVREVKYAEVVKNSDQIVFKIAADGFLYNMVRIMTGTLVAVAQGRIDPDEVPDIIDAKDRQRAGMTAPAQGLYLNRVVY